MHQGIANLLHHRLVELGISARDDQRNVLVQLVADIPHDPLEAVEGVADGHHAQVQAPVPDLFNQHGNGGVGLLQLAVPRALCQQAGTRAGDHQLADQIDQLIQFVGVHPNVASLLVFVLLVLVLFLERRVHHDSVDCALSDQYFSQLAVLCSLVVMLSLQAQSQFACRQRSCLDQQLPQHVVVFRQFIDEVYVFSNLAMRGQYGDAAVVTYEFKHIAQGALVGLGIDIEFIAEVAGFRIKMFPVGQGIVEGFDGAEGAHGAR